jgi:hypothetical protein
MVKRLLLVTLLAVLLLGVGAAFAKDPNIITITTKSYGPIAYIADGRLNGADVAAPVAIYYAYDKVNQPNGKTVQVLRGIQLLAIDPKTNTGKLALEVPASTLVNMIDTGKHQDGLLLGQNNGFSLYYSSANWFWVTAPADKEGKVYTFKWQNATVQHD